MKHKGRRVNNLRATATETCVVICGPRLAARVNTEIVVARGPCPIAFGTREAAKTAVLPFRASAVVGGKVLEAHQAQFGKEDVGQDWSVGGEAN